MPGGEELPGLGRHAAQVMEQASEGLLGNSLAGIETGRYLVEETAQQPCLTRAHEARENSHHIPQFHTAGLQSLVDDLLSPLFTEGS